MSNKSDRNRHRTHMVRVRMSDEEYEEFQQKLTKSGQTMQRFMLDAVQNGVFLDADLTHAVSELNRTLSEQYKQLRGMATNVNQMAYNSNLERLTGDGQAETRLQDMQVQVEEMRKECLETWQLLRQLMEQSYLTGR